ncbi:MAG: hypothetical protein GY774_26900 [Planctomycetes bacterium]|nr:hypothetical protein [Planctomycetota bacterium]
MTFEEAQAEFESIINKISTNSKAAEILEIKKNLESLSEQLPNTDEFDPIFTAIDNIQPKLTGEITAIVVDEIASRGAVLRGAVDLLKTVTDEAEADASDLRLEQPKLIAHTLTKSVESLKDICNDTKNGNYKDAATKTEALIVVLEKVKERAKS